MYSICACHNNAGINNPATTDETEQHGEEYESQIADLRENIPFNSNVKIEDRDGVINVSISYGCDPITQKSFAAMGQGIYYSKLYCDSVFDEYKLSFSLVDSKDMSIPLLWESSFGNWGMMIDTRSGETNVTTLNSLDDLFTFFPTISKDIRIAALDPQDAEIYNEVMSVLDSRPNDSETEIFEELASKYSMTSQQLYIFIKDVSEKVYSKSGDFDPKTPLVYPAYSESSLFGWYPLAPDIIYTTPASENGLGDNIYSFIGTVKEFGSIDSSGTELQYFILDTDKGPVLIYDCYGLAIALYSDQLESYKEPNSDYTFPNQSDHVKVYGVYSGYSNVFDMPSCIYGIPKFLY